MLSAGGMIGVYRVEREIARGGMGVVYEATDTSLGRRVALKVLLPGVADEAIRIRFRREAQALAQIENEHIVHVFAVGDLDDGEPYVVMELLAGQTLEERIEKGRISVRDAVRFAKQIATALVAAHAAGVLHRDLKPANLILVERPGRPPVLKLLDFGVAKHLYAPDALTRTGEALGSPAYMSPEQVSAHRDIDARTDVWSLGVTLHEMLVGSLPFGGTSVPQLIARITSSPAPSVVAQRPDVPAVLEAIVHRCLEKDREKRFAGAGAVLAALDSVSIEPKRKASSSLTFAVAVLAVVVAGASASAAFLVFGKLAPKPLVVTASSIVPSASVATLDEPLEPPVPELSAEPVVSASASARPEDPARVSITTTRAFVRPWLQQHRSELLQCLPKRAPRVVTALACAPHPEEGGVRTCFSGRGTGTEVPFTSACVDRLVDRVGLPTCSEDGCGGGVWITFTQ